MRRRLFVSLAVLVAATVGLVACATPAAFMGAEAAAGVTLRVYCGMTPEGRAEIRRQLGVRAQLWRCPGDPIPAGVAPPTT